LKHHVRVHLAAVGCPIVGDKLYGSAPSCLFEYLETGWVESLRERLMLPRQALHAAATAFTDPHTGQHMELICPLTCSDSGITWTGSPRPARSEFDKG
jgi:23S rRNA-/tRNA-specific pseudouridylate synthase